LRDVVQGRAAQATLASHSIPFLSAEGAQLDYLWRSPGGSTRIEPISQEELSMMNVAAIELGLDRGELLASCELFLFVEGDVDRVVLEELFRLDFRRLGICVVPLRGSSRATGVLDAAVLTRFSAARVAVWLDNVSEGLRRALEKNPRLWLEIKEDKDARAKLSHEERTICELVLEANEQEREVAILPHPGRDTFDLLADDVIKGLHSNWPGHVEARQVAEHERSRSGQRWKDVYHERYGIEVSPSVCRRIAQDMRERGNLPPALAEVVFRCQELLGDDLPE
jgi:hypothetical protein